MADLNESEAKAHGYALSIKTLLSGTPKDKKEVITFYKKRRLRLLRDKQSGQGNVKDTASLLSELLEKLSNR
jgi:hypothetical protein